MKLKYEIKKYRSIFNQSFEIEFGKINFIIGGNESGKSNILRAINIMGVDSNIKYIQKNDETQLAKQFKNQKNKMDLKKDFDKLQTSFKIIENNEKELFINTGGEPIWLINNSFYHNKLKNIINNKKGYFEKLVFGDNDSSRLIKKIIDDLQNKFIKYESFVKILKIPNFDSKLKDKIIEIYKNVKLNQPKTFLILPHEKASKINCLEYKVADINKTKSLIRAIFSSFGNQETVKELYSQTGEEPDRNTVIQRKELTKSVNNEIEIYFEKFKYIKATPELVTDYGNIYLNIKEKKHFKYDIHNDDENERSLGFKYFSRILVEIKAIIESKEYSRIIYMIDEPEQSLHPLLQEELIKELNNLIKDQNNVSIILATHSLYAFNITDNVLFVKKSSISNNKDLSGQSIIKPINLRKNLDFLLSKEKDLENKFIKRLLYDKRKIQLLNDEEIETIWSSQNANDIDFREGKIGWLERTKNLNYMNKNVQ